MATPARQSARLHLDLVRYQLLYAGRPVHLERQPMELLILLAKRQGELVSREDIAARLWGDGVFVDADQNINRAIRKLRLALRDDPERPKFLETVVGKGYRFSGDIEITEPATGTDQDSLHGSLLSAPDPTSTPKLAAPRRSYRWVLFSVLLIVVAMVAAALLRSRHITAPDVTRFRSIVVLPLENLSGAPDLPSGHQSTRLYAQRSMPSI